MRNTELKNSKLCFEVASECDGTRSEHFFSRKNACIEKYNFELFEISIIFLNLSGCKFFRFQEGRFYNFFYLERKVNYEFSRVVNTNS